jgi:SAM-dependent methyltransferase
LNRQIIVERYVVLMDFHAFEQAGWQRAAAQYGDAFGGVTSQTTASLLRTVGIRPGVRLLDVATGPGYVAEAAAAAGASVVGLDFSSEMVALARRRCPSVRFDEGDAESLPYDDASFDAVTINFGLLHLARPDTALAESARVLASGGRCGFTVWASPQAAAGFGMVLRAVDTHGRVDVPLPEGPPFFRFSDPDECRRAMRAVGFTDPDVVQLPLVWRMESADAVYDAFVGGAVRTAALLRAQTPEASAAIRRAVAEEVERYRGDRGIEIPMPAVLASATKA